MDNLQTLPNTQSSLARKITDFLQGKPVIYQFLRFGCIGALNTALNFLILNGISKALGIEEGLKLSAVSAVSFAVAVVQSYLWNRTWTFGNEQGVSIFKNFLRLIAVGLLGTLTVIFVLLGASQKAPTIYFVGLLAVYLIFETVLWQYFGFHLSDWNHQGHSFAVFFIVTLIGLGINSVLAGVISQNWHLTLNPDLNKNIAVIFATCASLIWNFVGYKVVVFKK